jgi:Tol biopolymer transport system component
VAGANASRARCSTPGGASSAPSLSADGRYVAFVSDATDLVALVVVIYGFQAVPNFLLNGILNIFR